MSNSSEKFVITRSHVAWLAAVLVLVMFISLTKAVLLPFLAGLAVAYLLDPAADTLEDWGLSRSAAAAIVLLVFFLSLLLLVLGFWPIIQSQLGTLAATVPDALSKLRPWLNEQLTLLSETYGTLVPADVESLLSSVASDVLQQVKEGATRVLAGSLALFSLVSLLLITPVVAFYLLRDWDRMVARADQLLPHRQASTLRRLLGQIDGVLAGFVRGQLLIAAVMAVLYAVGWSAVGLQNGLLLGLLAGSLGIIPFVGALFGAIVAMIMALTQWGLDPLNLALVAGVYGIVQGLEGVLLTPKLVGDRVKLHPVWVLFAVFAGGEVMGFVGVLIAVPVAAAIAVLVRYGLEQYQATNLPPGETLVLSDAENEEAKPDTLSASNQDL